MFQLGSIALPKLPDPVNLSVSDKANGCPQIRGHREATSQRRSAAVLETRTPTLTNPHRGVSTQFAINHGVVLVDSACRRASRQIDANYQLAIT